MVLIRLIRIICHRLIYFYAYGVFLEIISYLGLLKYEGDKGTFEQTGIIMPKYANLNLP